jgi:hypothetical protein
MAVHAQSRRPQMDGCGAGERDRTLIFGANARKLLKL